MYIIYKITHKCLNGNEYVVAVEKPSRGVNESLVEYRSFMYEDEQNAYVDEMMEKYKTTKVVVYEE